MKVLVVHNAYPQHGGEETVVENEIRMLKKHGVEVASWIIPTEESGFLNLIRCGLSAVWNPVIYFKLRRILKHEKPDIVHCHNVFPLISPSIFTACHHIGIPVGQTIHNYRYVCPAGLLLRDGKTCEECLGKRFFTPALRHKCYRNSRIATMIPTLANTVQRALTLLERQTSFLIALADFQKRKLTEGGLPEQKIIIKPNFCPDHIRTPENRSIEPRTFCYASRLSSEKGITVLLDAWRILERDWRTKHGESMDPPVLKIAGDGDLAGLVKETSQEIPSIQYLGKLTHNEVMDMISKSTGLIVPSVCYEGMPMTIIESFCVGTPVISSRIGGLPDMVDAGKTGFLFEPGNAGQLKEAIYELLDDNAKQQTMEINARSAYDAHYSEEANFHLLHDIYKNSMNAAL